MNSNILKDVTVRNHMLKTFKFPLTIVTHVRIPFNNILDNATAIHV